LRVARRGRRSPLGSVEDYIRQSINRRRSRRGKKKTKRKPSAFTLLRKRRKNHRHKERVLRQTDEKEKKKSGRPLKEAYTRKRRETAPLREKRTPGSIWQALGKKREKEQSCLKEEPWTSGKRGKGYIT